MSSRSRLWVRSSRPQCSSRPARINAHAACWSAGSNARRTTLLIGSVIVAGTVPDLAFVFALIAGVAMAVYTIFSRLAAAGVHPALGAMVVTGVAFLVNVVLVLVLRANGVTLTASASSVALLTVVGAAAASADFFTLSAYAGGLRATSSFVIPGTTTVLVLLVGFVVLREPFSWAKLAAIALITGGILLLHREGV